VGAGPGDAGLITVRGREALSRAGVVIYDAPCEPALLAFAAATAERIPVGRWPDEARLSQADINALLVDRVRAGAQVVRLKNGDPFIFGRGGEEAQALAAHGLPFAIVPGVPAFVAAAEYAGIPVTLRALSSQLVVAFAQSGAGPEEWELDLDALSRAPGTLALYLEPSLIAGVARELVRRGRDPRTPAAIVSGASLPSQRIHEGPLGDLGAQGAQGPCVLFIGEAVAARGPLAWAERRPLAGRAIVLTRAAHENAELAAPLEALGAQILEVPCIAIAPPERTDAMDGAIGSLERFDTVVFSSAHGVEHFLARLEALGRDARALAGVRLAVIGSATGAALRKAYLLPDVVPPEFHSEALVQVLLREGIEGKRFLLVRPQEGREVLQQELEKRGAKVEVAIAYRTVRPAADVSEVRARAAEGRLAAVAFASPSAVRNFAAHFEEGEAVRLLRATCVAAIGPVTAQAVEALGVRVAVQPAQSTAEALAQALAAELGKSRCG
jgi:uroporphyrinogen III methyltransferase/synthase